MIRIVLIILVCCTFYSSAFSADSTHSYHSIFETGSLIGTWQMETGGKTLYETWKNVSDNTIEGTSILELVSTNRKDTTSIEAMRLISMEGEVFLIIKPDETKYPVSFKLTSTLDNTLIFENDNNTFPKKIIYKFKDKDNIDIEINNEKRRIYLYYKRVK